MRRQTIFFGVLISAISNAGYAQEVSSGSSAPMPEHSKSSVTRVSKDSVSKPDVALSPPALEAVRVSEKWRGESISPVAGADGRVIYNFGAGLPTVVCAPLRVCMIELQAGEKLEWRTADWRFSSMEYCPGSLRQRRPNDTDYRSETADGRARYESADHNRSTRLLLEAHLEASGIRRSRRVSIPARSEHPKVAGAIS
jgi:hypothetical protein